MPSPSRSQALAATIAIARSRGVSGKKFATHQPDMMWVWMCIGCAARSGSRRAFSPCQLETASKLAGYTALRLRWDHTLCQRPQFHLVQSLPARHHRIHVLVGLDVEVDDHRAFVGEHFLHG